ncbi:hypothetical protein MKX01_006791 [Papaver californicum]|nr:hypothetical protein MKX01_006791 [Papaver californicum]
MASITISHSKVDLLNKRDCDHLKSHTTSNATSERWITHYSSSHKILLLNIKDLQRLGCLVLHNVDVNFMASSSFYPLLACMKFDRIVFNFPHAGHFKMWETHHSVIQKHKDLLSGFFKSSRKMLKLDGEVHVAHRDDHPYNAWEIEELANEAGLILIATVDFCSSQYMGYNYERGSSLRSNGSFPLGNCPKTFKFSLKSS